ncbi:MAG: hypothetical protein AB1421_10310 [Pseudomonadota bacterium]
MKLKVLFALFVACATNPALAGDWGSVFGQPLPAVAQMSQEERRTLRERWERSSPEERARLRKDFQERLRRVPGGEYATRGMETGEEMGQSMGQRMVDGWRDSNYGEGYERRHREDDGRDDSRRDDRRDRFEQRSRDRR